MPGCHAAEAAALVALRDLAVLRALRHGDGAVLPNRPAAAGRQDCRGGTQASVPGDADRSAVRSPRLGPVLGRAQ